MWWVATRCCGPFEERFFNTIYKIGKIYMLGFWWPKTCGLCGGITDWREDLMWDVVRDGWVLERS